MRNDSHLDREAVKRGNYVYFPDRVIPMLPEKISNDLCSLKEGVDRPALAVRMVFDADGRKKSHSFHRIMCARWQNSLCRGAGRHRRRPERQDRPDPWQRAEAALGRL